MRHILALLLFSGLAFAQQVITPFSIRYSTNDRGAITLIANTLMCAPVQGSSSLCDTSVMNNPSENNNFHPMIFINADTSAPTWSSGRGGSSSADLSLPPGSQILFAGLYWGAQAGNGASGHNQIFIKPPGSTSYQPITGILLGTTISYYYSAFADVTSLVRNAGNGTYWVGGILARTGRNFYAGWSLVVVYRDTSQPLRNLVVYDGLASAAGGSNNLTVTPSGFLAPYSGPVNARVGAMAFDGDGGTPGDRLRLNGNDLSDSQNPADNFFNSSVSLLGTRFSSKNPDYLNQMGMDADIVDATGRIPNGATSATLQFISTGDGYFPTVLTFQIDLYAPDLKTTFAKSAADLNGGSLVPGDILEYTLSFSNTGQDGATGVVLTDPIPPHTQYVPGSLVVVSNAAGAPTGSFTDASGDDIAEYDPANNRVVFRLGDGASASSGGLIPPGQGAMVRFRVQVLPSAADQTLTNTAQISYASQTMGTSYSETASVSTSSTVSSTVYTLAGAVYHDLQPNGVREGSEDWSSGVAVYVKLLQGSTVQVATVNPGTGAFSFTSLAQGSYTLVLDDNPDPSDTVPTPPSGWHFIQPISGQRAISLNADATGQDFGLFRGTRLSGRVFYDDGEGSGTPNNALQDGGERGAATTVTASDGTHTRTASTDGQGNYLLWIPRSWGSVTLSHPLRPATGWNDGTTATRVVSWSQATSPASPGAVLDLGAASGLPPSLVRNLGVVRTGTFQPDQSGQSTSPGTITYSHFFQPGTLGSVTFSLSSPASFGYQARLDANCNGVWDSGEVFTPLPQSFTVGAAWPREPDGRLRACALEVQVLVPAGQPAGRVEIALLQAALQWAGNPGVTEVRSLSDTTTIVLPGGLRLEKRVRNATQGTAFATSAGGRPGEVLEYRIAYQNIGAQPIFNVVLADPVPFFTDLVQNAYAGTGEVELVCPDGSAVRPDLGSVNHISLNLAALCSLSTAPYPGGSGPVPALLPGQGGHFLYRVQVR